MAAIVAVLLAIVIGASVAWTRWNELWKQRQAEALAALAQYRAAVGEMRPLLADLRAKTGYLVGASRAAAALFDELSRDGAALKTQAAELPTKLDKLRKHVATKKQNPAGSNRQDFKKNVIECREVVHELDDWVGRRARSLGQLQSTIASIEDTLAATTLTDEKVASLRGRLRVEREKMPEMYDHWVDIGALGAEADEIVNDAGESKKEATRAADALRELEPEYDKLNIVSKEQLDAWRREITRLEAEFGSAARDNKQ